VRQSGTDTTMGMSLLKLIRLGLYLLLLCLKLGVGVVGIVHRLDVLLLLIGALSRTDLTYSRLSHYFIHYKI